MCSQKLRISEFLLTLLFLTWNTTKNYFFRDKFFMTTNLFVTKTILFMTTRQANVLQKPNMFFYLFHCLKLLSPHQFVRKSFHSPSIFFPPVFSPFWTQKNLEGNQTYDMETGKQRNTFPYLLLLEQQRQRNTFSKSVTCLHISNNKEQQRTRTCLHLFQQERQHDGLR